MDPISVFGRGIDRGSDHAVDRQAVVRFGALRWSRRRAVGVGRRWRWDVLVLAVPEAVDQAAHLPEQPGRDPAPWRLLLRWWRSLLGLLLVVGTQPTEVEHHRFDGADH